MLDLVKAKQILIKGGYTAVLCHADTVYTSKERGVLPLVKWIDNKLNLNGFSAADKVIGKATAFLYIILGVKEVYATVISKSALEVFENHDVLIEYDQVVENIINRQGNGICPFEAVVLNIGDTEKAYDAIKAKMKEMGIAQK